MSLENTALQNLPDLFSLDQPCCAGELAISEVTGELPDPAVLQQELDLVQSQISADVDDLLFADFDSEELTFQQELELAGLTKQPLPPLEEILSIAERYPGLKVTFSF